MTFTIITRHSSRFTVNHGGICKEVCLPYARGKYTNLISEGYIVHTGNPERMFRETKGNEQIEDFLAIVPVDWLPAGQSDLLMQRDSFIDMLEAAQDEIESLQSVADENYHAANRHAKRIKFLDERIAQLERRNEVLQNQLNTLGQTAVAIREVRG